jgi:hypothetical protein
MNPKMVETQYPETPTIETLLQGASVAYKIATGPNSGQKVRKIGSLGLISDEPFSRQEIYRQFWEGIRFMRQRTFIKTIERNWKGFVGIFYGHQ